MAKALLQSGQRPRSSLMETMTLLMFVVAAVGGPTSVIATSRSTTDKLDKLQEVITTSNTRAAVSEAKLDATKASLDVMISRVDAANDVAAERERIRRCILEVVREEAIKR